ncbi:uncharacterized protein M421DRAFT_425841 [Didymella exigua CBS 183.55]|uniref:Zn(2)-C6 fungal-type domain-containing protein n=1 Tax=Didymella exigua CBS 183.55 TaxID=1150837 RepID=A0A6A5R830_9PLEO|nr:uncharacterized protein M421DRAFT_425841 [Didymella exigua CBS 183.55]KAF1923469.1 hypothetical protein M421DRAFT_425841 [Didymella exigua CBS 183.55]
MFAYPALQHPARDSERTVAYCNSSMESTLTAFRALQPASAAYLASRQQCYHSPIKTPRAKRRPALGACVACRERKSRCDGHRPVCECCVQRDTPCVYELGVNETPSDARRRKKEEMQTELDGLRHLYNSLRSCPEHEAFEILHWVRLSPSDTLTLDCSAGLPHPLAQPHPHHALPAAAPRQLVASPSSRPAKVSRQSRAQELTLPRTSIGFLLQTSPTVGYAGSDG